MRYLFILCFVIFSKQLTAQSFNIDPIVVDSISLDRYYYHVSGIGFFNASSVLQVELFDETNQENVFFRGSYSFEELKQEGISEFSYNTETKEFRFNIGNFSTRSMYLHMWIEEGDEVKNELYYK